MRWFDSIAFMGNGKMSRADANLLKRRIDQGLSILSAMQQAAFDKAFQDYIAMDDDREDIVRDIAAALLGKEVTFGTDLPYPGKLGNIRYTKSGRRVKNA